MGSPREIRELVPKNCHPRKFALQKFIYNFSVIKINLLKKFNKLYNFSVLDKIDEAIEWFSLVIGNILDATINKNNTETEETAARTSFKTLY